jgi:flavin reductase (DIM6/NTAB) family NADH-FMN oxidoreductase RutF
LTVNPQDLPTSDLYAYLSTAVAPRPIALASTISADGQVNLSPFSYFNVFSTTPPILVFSPILRGRDGSAKDTLLNLREVGEVTINIVDYAIVEQVSLASTGYPKGVNEFEKSGLTEVASEAIRPPRVGESPVSFECVVDDIVALGEGGGAGNLVLCRVVRMHLADRCLDANNKLITEKLDLVARLGGSYYARMIPEALFEIPKPLRNCGIGVDQLPAQVRNSKVLTGNHLGRLGNLAELPAQEQLDELVSRPEIQDALAGGEHATHQLAADLLDRDRPEDALALLLHQAGATVR